MPCFYRYLIRLEISVYRFDIKVKFLHRTTQIVLDYSIVKDSSADLGVNFKIVQNRPTVKAVCIKISKFVFCIFVNIFIFLRGNKEVSFFIF